MASFRQRGKKWEYRISYYKNGKREPISKGGFNTKAEARAAANKVEHQLNMGVDVKKGDQLFIDYYKNWIKTYKLGAFSHETDKTYNHAMKLVEKYFPELKLKEITRDRYQQFLNEYSEGRSRETVRKAHTKVGACLRDAFNTGDIPNNPAYKPTFRGVDGVKESTKYLHAEEAKDVMQELLRDLKVSYTSRYMLLLQFATGMRISEVMAIQFEDLNFLNNTVHINKSWDYKFDLDFKPTKNREERKITVDSDTMKYMKQLYDYQLSKKIIDGKRRLFAVNGKIPSTNAINKTLKRACIRANVEVVTSHALRHTHASLLLLNDVSVAYISKRLGHRNISITTDVYSHVLDELEIRSEQTSADILNQFYN